MSAIQSSPTSNVRWMGASVSVPWPWTTVLVKSSSTSSVILRQALRGTPPSAHTSAMNCATAGSVSRRAGKTLWWFPVSTRSLVLDLRSPMKVSPTRLLYIHRYAGYASCGVHSGNDLMLARCRGGNDEIRIDFSGSAHCVDVRRGERRSRRGRRTHQSVQRDRPDRALGAATPRTGRRRRPAGRPGDHGRGRLGGDHVPRQ